MDVGLMVVFCIIEVVHINVSSALLCGIVEDGISCAHEEQTVVENHPERFAYGLRKVIFSFGRIAKKSRENIK